MLRLGENVLYYSRLFRKDAFFKIIFLYTGSSVSFVLHISVLSLDDSFLIFLQLIDRIDFLIFIIDCSVNILQQISLK